MNSLDVMTPVHVAVPVPTLAEGLATSWTDVGPHLHRVGTHMDVQCRPVGKDLPAGVAGVGLVPGMIHLVLRHVNFMMVMISGASVLGMTHHMASLLLVADHVTSFLYMRNHGTSVQVVGTQVTSVLVVRSHRVFLWVRHQVPSLL